MINWVATRYYPTDPAQGQPLLYVEQYGAGWAITSGGACLNREGEWEFQPMPSSRDEEYLARTRYTREEAFAVAEKWLAEHDHRHGTWVVRIEPVKVD